MIDKRIYSPDWPDLNDYNQVIQKINQYPSLVYPDEIIRLKNNLKQVAKGNQFVIQGGDCAETFNDFNTGHIKSKLKILLQMSAIIEFTSNMKVLNIGRIAGQYFKPRSNLTETRGEIVLPAYQGDGINCIDFLDSKRIPDPNNLIKAYHHSAATMNLIRTLIMTGFTKIENVSLWNRDLITKSKLGIKYNKIVKEIEGALDFVMASSDVKNKDNYLNNLYTSHESLLLDYEKVFIKNYKDYQFCCSSHMVWVGDRTRLINGDHLKFVSKLDNPIGIKIGPSISIDDINKICTTVNPNNEKGKLIFIIRLGEKNIEKILPKIIEKVKYYGHEIIWFCDPMHGNTVKSKNGYKTRHFKTIINELESFFNIHNSEKTIPGGVHIELTGKNVTECLGGINDIQDKDLDLRYETACDPRLNNEQSLEIAFLISKLIKQRKNNGE